MNGYGSGSYFCASRGFYLDKCSFYVFFGAIMHRNRQALVKRGDATFRDKQESLDLLDFLESEKIPVYGIEIVKLTSKNVESDMYKTVWYQDQQDVYHNARLFIKEKMGGAWNYAEFKL